MNDYGLIVLYDRVPWHGHHRHTSGGIDWDAVKAKPSIPLVLYALSNRRDLHLLGEARPMPSLHSGDSVEDNDDSGTYQEDCDMDASDGSEDEGSSDSEEDGDYMSEDESEEWA